MFGSGSPFHYSAAEALSRKLRLLGLDDEGDRQVFLMLVKARGQVGRGEDIVRVGNSLNYFTVLLEGLGCRYRMVEDGRRQIFAFQYPGDFCGFDRYLLATGEDAVGALTDCSIGIIRHEDIERAIRQHPRIGHALWRGTMVEANIFQERLLNVSQRPALVRIANLLCEQMVRLEALGLGGADLLMTQVDLADAAGLSVVHVNRTVQELRELGILCKDSRAIKIVARDRLMAIAKFDGSYLNVPRTPLPGPSAPSAEAPRAGASRQPPLPGNGASIVGRKVWPESGEAASNSPSQVSPRKLRYCSARSRSARRPAGSTTSS
jgi:CRP-like cAMP-binding protein